MAAALAVAWGALRLDGAALRRWSAGRRALACGLALLAAGALLGGAAAGAVGTGACLHRPPAAPAEYLLGWLARSPLPPDVQYELARNSAAALELRADLAALPRPLGREAGCALQALQRAAAAPYRRLALWLPYTLAVFAAARALGSRAGLAQTLAAASLCALPHLLDWLQAAPGVGPLFGIVLSVWGAAIYLCAIGAVSGLGRARTLVAVLLPGVTMVTLAAVLLSVVTVVLL